MNAAAPAIRLFNPDLLSKEDLLRGFIARQELLDRLLDDFRRTGVSGTAQHQLLLGQRGSGKTTLLRRLAYAIEDDATLSQTWRALVFPEEQYNIANLGNFWLNCLGALSDSWERQGNEAESERLDKRIEAIANSKSDDALQTLLDESQRIGKRLVLLVDNFDQVFDRIGEKEEWTFRRILQEHKEICLVGASSRVIEASYEHGRSFYDFFQVHELKGLNDHETVRLLRHLAKASNSDRVEQAIESRAGKVKTIRLMTGGNPRTLALLYRILETDAEGSAEHDLEILLDSYTPHYKARVEELSQQGQRILDAVALHWDPITAQAASEATGLTVNLVSAQLKRLEELGVIEKVEAFNSKKAHFLIAERFFNIWYLMRSGRRAKRRLAWLIGFAESWYSQEEVCAKTAHLLDLAKTGKAIENLAPKILAFTEAIHDGTTRTGFEIDTLRTLIARNAKTEDLDLRNDLQIRAERMRRFAKARAEASSLRADWGTVQPDTFVRLWLGNPAWDAADRLTGLETISDISISELAALNDALTAGLSKPMVGACFSSRTMSRVIDAIASGEIENALDWRTLFALGGYTVVYASFFLVLRLGLEVPIDPGFNRLDASISEMLSDTRVRSLAKVLTGDLMRARGEGTDLVQAAFHEAVRFDPDSAIAVSRLVFSMCLTEPANTSGLALLENYVTRHPEEALAYEAITITLTASNVDSILAAAYGANTIRLDASLPLADRILQAGAEAKTIIAVWKGRTVWKLAPPALARLIASFLAASIKNYEVAYRYLTTGLERANGNPFALYLAAGILFVNFAERFEEGLGLLYRAFQHRQFRDSETARLPEFLTAIEPAVGRVRLVHVTERLRPLLDDSQDAELLVAAMRLSAGQLPQHELNAHAIKLSSTGNVGIGGLAFVKAIIETHGAATLLDLLKANGDPIRPLVEAIRAIGAGDRNYLSNVAPEVRSVAEDVLRQLKPEWFAPKPTAP
jgi:DNA-binding Lrp family transcriptional regulator